MKLTLLYSIGCMIIACLVIYEALLLNKMQGKLKKTTTLSVISAVEFLWLVLSGLALYNLEFPHALIMILPTLYIFESIFGWIYGFHLLSKSGMLEKLEKDDSIEMTIPMKYADFTLSFGLVFSVLASLAIVFELKPELFPV